LKLEREIRRGAIRKPSLRSTQDSLAIAEAALKYGNSPPSKSKAPSSSAYTKRRPRTRIIDEHVSSQLFAIHKTLKVLFSCGHWDHSFKATSVESGRLLQSVTAHKDAVTCLAMTSEYGRTWLITGSRDCTLMVWEVQSNREMPIAESPLHILYGHDDAVTSVSVNAELDVVVSGSVDGTVIVHSLREGSYTRSILVGSMPTKNPQTGFNLPASNTPVTSTRRRIHWVCVTKESFVVVYLIDEQLLCTYTVNGRMVAVKDIRERLYSLVPSEDGQVLVTGGENCLVVMRWVSSPLSSLSPCPSSSSLLTLCFVLTHRINVLQIYNLEIANDGPRKGLEAVLDGMIEDNEGSRHTFTSPIRSIYFTKHERHLIVGSENGEIRIFAQDSDYLRQRLQVKLEEIGIL
jgi:WD40 repeat protein